MSFCYVVGSSVIVASCLLLAVVGAYEVLLVVVRRALLVCACYMAAWFNVSRHLDWALPPESRAVALTMAVASFWGAIAAGARAVGEAMLRLHADVCVSIRDRRLGRQGCNRFHASMQAFDRGTADVLEDAGGHGAAFLYIQTPDRPPMAVASMSGSLVWRP